MVYRFKRTAAVISAASFFPISASRPRPSRRLSVFAFALAFLECGGLSAGGGHDAALPFPSAVSLFAHAPAPAHLRSARQLSQPLFTGRSVSSSLHKKSTAGLICFSSFKNASVN